MSRYIMTDETHDLPIPPVIRGSASVEIEFESFTNGVEMKNNSTILLYFRNTGANTWTVY